MTTIAHPDLAGKCEINASGILSDAQITGARDAILALEDVEDVSTVMSGVAAREPARV